MADLVSVEGADQVSRDLRAAASDLQPSLRAANRRIATLLESRARSDARSGVPLQRAAASAIIGDTDHAGAFLTVESTRIPFAFAAFLGARRRTGWFSAARYEQSTRRQFPRYVGDSWTPGSTGGPYAINDALRRSLDEVESAYAGEVDDVLSRHQL